MWRLSVTFHREIKCQFNLIIRQCITLVLIVFLKDYLLFQGQHGGLLEIIFIVYLYLDYCKILFVLCLCHTFHLTGVFLTF